MKQRTETVSGSFLPSVGCWTKWRLLRFYLFGRKPLLRGSETKTSPIFSWHIFVNLMEKEPCAKFCGVLVRFHELIKLKVLNLA